jgi:hypothetical protein
MYARYNYTAAATLVNIINDAVAVLTGETNKANLSVGCDQANTFILTTYNVAGWLLHDQTVKSVGAATITQAAPGVLNHGTQAGDLLSTNLPVSLTTTGTLPAPLAPNTIYYVSATGLGAAVSSLSATPGGATITTTSAGSGTHTLWCGHQFVLKGVVADDPTTYKYALLDFFGAGFLNLFDYESWNNTTHVGTNLAVLAASTTFNQRITVGTAASFAVSSKSSHIQIQSIVAAGIGSSTANEFAFLWERSRLSPWDTVANAYPPSLCGSSGAFVGGGNGNNSAGKINTPRYKNPNGGDFTGAGNPLVYLSGDGWQGDVVGSLGTNSMYKKVPDGVGGFYTPLNEIKCRYALNAFLGGSVSAICDVWTTVAYPNNLDQVTANGKAYILWQISNAANPFIATLYG